MEHLSPHICHIFHNRLDAGLNVFAYFDCYKCGQTSGPVVGTQIQTSCIFEANICGNNSFLGCLYRYYCVVLLEQHYIVTVYLYNYLSVPSNFKLLLHKVFFDVASSSSSSSSAKQCSSPTEPNNSAKHCAIQKNSVQCTVGTVDISSLFIVH